MVKKLKKPTKKELIAQLPKMMEAELKKNRINDMVGGFEIANNMILGYIESEKSLEEVKTFVHKNTTESRVTINNFLNKENKEEKEEE